MLAGAINRKLLVHSSFGGKLALLVIPSYTAYMKTAIGLPDDVFSKAEDLARKKGLSRSELYVAALREYIRQQERANLTEEINRAIDEIGEEAFRVDPVMMAYQARRLAKEDW